MQAQVKAWGNSQGIRISKDILQEANVAIDDVLDVKVVNGMITLVKPFRHKTLEERAGEIVECPIFQDSTASPLHIKIRTDSTEGYVQCEKVALFDLNARVHMLVPYSFVDKINKNHKEVRHLDGDKLNNKFDNLQWCEDNTTYIKFDNTVDISKIKLIAPDEIFAIAKTDNKVYNAYLISNYGRLYSKHIKKVVKGNIDGQGYKKYMLGRNNNISAHCFVGFSFVENPNIEDFDRINHKDENRINNYYKNLEWCDNDYNLNYNKNDTWEERTAPRPAGCR